MKPLPATSEYRLAPNSTLERLGRLPRPLVLLLGLLLIAVIAWIDVVTGPKLVFNVFYLLPVMFVAWVTASTAYGLAAVLVTFLVGPLEAYVEGFHFYSLPVAVWNAGMRTAVFCIVLLLLAEVRRLIARLQEQSSTDELTGLANRRVFLTMTEREIERSRRYGHVLSLAYLDVDDFKAVNDRDGHLAGDRVLVALASLARATARSVDTVARLGGDEFVILMPETDAEAALPLAERLCVACAQAAGSVETGVTCSIGLVTFAHPPRDVEEVLTNADRLMYEAKAAGGNGVRHAPAGPAEPLQTVGKLLPFASPSGN
jgi:diguanylate cyclase (GGDEF)-like protein